MNSPDIYHPHIEMYSQHMGGTGMLCFTVVFISAATGICILLPQQHAGTAAFYFSICGLSCILIHNGSYCMPPFSKGLYFLSFLTLFFILGFRNGSGIDDWQYEVIFLQTKEFGFLKSVQLSGIESGYILLNYFIGLFFDDYIAVQVICCAITLSLVYIELMDCRDSISAEGALLLYLAYVFFSYLSVALVRIFLASAIIIFAMRYVWRKKPWKFLICLVISFGIHRSALLMTPIIVFAIWDKETIKKRWKKIVIICTVGIPIALLVVANYVVPYLGVRYAGYAHVGNLSFNWENFDMLPLLLFALFCRKQLPQRYLEKYYVGCTMLSLSVILSAFSGLVNFGRGIFYYNMGALYTLPILAKNAQNDTIRKLTLAIIVIYSITYITITQLINANSIPTLFPYRNCLF